MRKLSLAMLFVMLAGFMAIGQPYQIPLDGKGSKAQVVNSDYQQLNMQFSFDKLNGFDVSNKAGIVFTELNFDDAHAVGNIGEPKLPALKKLIEIPAGAVVSVKVLNFKEEEIKLANYGITNQLMPVQPSLRKDQDVNQVPFEYSKEAYGKNSFTERPIATVEELGTLRGVRIARLVISPVDYNPVTGELKVYNDIDVQVEFRNANVELTKEIKAKTYSPYFDVVYSKLANYNGKDVFVDHPDLVKYPIKYLVIADRMFESTLAPFIAWKTQKGFEVIVAYTDVIGNTNTAIKNYITAQYNAGTVADPAPSFILFVGDTPQIPASATGSESGVATDLYYGSIDGDYFPEMYYGRLSARNTTQLQNQIDKILYYEKYQFADPTYLNNVTLIAGSDGNWNPNVGQPTVQYGTTNFFNQAHGFSTVNAYLSTYSGCYDPAKIAVSFINYTAHCSQTSWGDPNLTISAVNAFTNANKYPLAVGNCCQAADFGYDECMGEAWMRGANKGSVAYIGSSPSSYWFEDFYWSVGAFPIQGDNDGYVPTLSETTLGAYEAPFASNYVSVDALVFVGNLAVTEVDIMNYPSHSTPTYYWQAYNCLGDPSTMIYLTEGEDNTVSHMQIVPIGLNTYTVNALPGSYVAISKDGVLHGAAMVDNTGEVIVPIDPILAGGNVDIVVTRPQTKPYMVQVPAAALEGPYIVLDSYTVNDATGNNNQTADYGETIKLNVTLKNVGADPGTGITATISGTDSYLTISGTATQTFGTISATAGSNTAVVNNAFTLVVSNATPDQHLASFTITINGAKTTWTSTLKVRVNAPVLTIGGMVIDDDGAGIPTVLDPGETANAIIEVKNEGHAALTSVNATLTTTNNMVTINTSTAVNLGSLAVGETKNASFSVTASAAAPLETPVTVTCNVTGGQYNDSEDKEIIIGLIPAYNMEAGTVTACIGKFYDSGGPDGEYANSESIVMTIAPAVEGNIIQMTFSAFETENSYDKLFIYNGNSESAPQIAGSPFQGTTNPGTILALNASGALTFKFTSDGTAVRPGWAAQWACVDVSTPPVCAQNPTPSNNAVGFNPLAPLSWNLVAGAFSYDVYVGTGSLPAEVTANVVTNSYLATLTANTSYVWKVVAKNNAGDATGCQTWSFTTGDMPSVINMSNTTVTTCNGLFYDAGGPNAEYGSSQDFTLTFVPATQGAMVQVAFTMFDLEANATCNYDKLSIYDGANASATLIGAYCGTSSPGTVTATNADGKLTFVFHSDGSVTKPGWAATVSCYIESINITFNVTDSYTSEPISGASIAIPDHGTQVTNASGYATFVDFADGNYTYSITKDGYTTAGGTITIEGTSVTADVEMDPIMQTVTFTVTDGTGPVAGANIMVDEMKPELVTNASGIATINLPAGNYWYSVVKEGFLLVAAQFEVDAAAVPVNVTLMASAGIQVLPFNESFEGETFPPAGWANLDFDGDTHSWEAYEDTENNTQVALSASWEDGALTPDNYLVTPAIALTASEGQTILLKYKVAATGSDSYAEHYAIYVQGLNMNEEGIVVFEETLTELESGKNYAERVVDLTQFAGDTVYIMFNHVDCTNMDALLIDEVEVYATNIYSINFNVDMRQVESFDPTTAQIFVTGDMNNWMEPGMDMDCQLHDANADTIYTMSFEMEAGNLAFEFYLGTGWNGGEFPGEDHRVQNIVCDTTINFIFGQKVGIIDNGFNRLAVYPNPFINNLIISNAEKIQNVTVTNLMGQALINMNASGSKIELNTSELSEGIYFVSITNAKGNVTVKKLMKQ